MTRSKNISFFLFFILIQMMVGGINLLDEPLYLYAEAHTISEAVRASP